jgi:predicted DCC family thiol-disulfide oxidoreductase YuxK
MKPRDVEHDAAAVDSDRPILFFDGVCGLCSAVVDWIIQRDRSHRIRFAPLQGTTAARLVPAELRSQLSTLVFRSGGHNHLRSAAVCRILLTLGGVWRIFGGMLWLIPWPLRDLGYRLVAKVRYRLFGRHETCRLPTPAERGLFLD